MDFGFYVIMNTQNEIIGRLNELFSNGSLSGQYNEDDIAELTDVILGIISAYEIASIEDARDTNHDINSYLVGVIGYVILAMKENEDPKVEEHLKDAVRYGNRIKRLIEHAAYDPSLFDLRGLLEEDIRTAALGKEGRIYDLTLPEKEVRIHADRGNIGRVVMGLAKNAFEAIERDPKKRGKLEVTAKSDDNDAYVLFKNQQVIPKYIFDRIFIEKVSSKWSGRGLTRYPGLMKEDNGEITMQSSKEEGTIFQIQLPLYKVKANI